MKASRADWDARLLAPLQLLSKAPAHEISGAFPQCCHFTKYLRIHPDGCGIEFRWHLKKACSTCVCWQVESAEGMPKRRLTQKNVGMARARK